jgi:hypothetical protein
MPIVPLPNLVVVSISLAKEYISRCGSRASALKILMIILQVIAFLIDKFNPKVSSQQVDDFMGAAGKVSGLCCSWRFLPLIDIYAIICLP